VNFDTSKNLSGVGALLIFIGAIISPVATAFGSGAVALVGFILLLIGVKGIAAYYREASIFNNMLYGTIVGIVGAVVSSVVLIAGLLYTAKDFIYKLYPSWNGDWASLSSFSGVTPDTTNLAYSDVAPILTVVLAAFVLAFVFVLVVALFYRKSLTALRQKSEIGLFGSAATVLLVGAVLTIIFIGYLLVWIAVLLVAIAFFQMKQPPPPEPTLTEIPPTV
jgi:uncharacterized membrane protein